MQESKILVKKKKITLNTEVILPIILVLENIRIFYDFRIS